MVESKVLPHITHAPFPFSHVPFPLGGLGGIFTGVVAFFLATLFDWSRNVEVPQLIGRDVTLRGQSEICVTKKGNKFTENSRNLLLFFLAAHSDWLPPYPRPFFSRSVGNSKAKGEP